LQIKNKDSSSKYINQENRTENKCIALFSGLYIYSTVEYSSLTCGKKRIG
jgi:hypothetical protein